MDGGPPGDGKLLGWARAVKARRSPRSADLIPPLWLFTDDLRRSDPLPAVARLPRGLAGVVFRHDGVAGRRDLGLRIARLCRERRLLLVVAGDVRLAARLGAGVHLRAGRWPGPVRPPPNRLVTSSAHGAADLRRARLAGAGAGFLSPIFATASHPGAATLGVQRWNRLAMAARRGGFVVLALGGIDGRHVRRLPRGACAGAGAIGALG
jgi:thiamine-phosphate pyrophosphorylase